MRICLAVLLTRLSCTHDSYVITHPVVRALTDIAETV
jgi:hypothetical protein